VASSDVLLGHWLQQWQHLACEEQMRDGGFRLQAKGLKCDRWGREEEILPVSS